MAKTSAAVPIPVPAGKRRVFGSVPLTPAQVSDATMTFTLSVEVSGDGGQSWSGASAVFVGPFQNRDGTPNANPGIELSFLPVGVRLLSRASVQSAAALVPSVGVP